MKIRHYGFLSNRGKQKLKIHLMTQGKIPAATIKLNYKQVCKQLLKFDVDECPVCKKGRMITLLNFSANAPPSMEIIKEIKRQKFKGVISLEYEVNPKHNMSEMHENVMYYLSQLGKL